MISMAAGTVLDPENGRMRLAPGMWKKRFPLSRLWQPLRYQVETVWAQAAAWQVPLQKGRCVVPTLKRQLDVLSAQRPRLATAQGSQ